MARYSEPRHTGTAAPRIGREYERAAPDPRRTRARLACFSIGRRSFAHGCAINAYPNAICLAYEWLARCEKAPIAPITAVRSALPPQWSAAMVRQHVFTARQALRPPRTLLWQAGRAPKPIFPSLVLSFDILQ